MPINANANTDRLTQIEQRLAAIQTALDAPDADLDALTAEADGLIAERKNLLDKAEQRRQLLGRIATGTAGNEVRRFPTAQPPEERSFGYDSPEYRTAWLHTLMRCDLTETEQRAWTTATGSAGPAVPTQTANQILSKVHQYAPLLDKITLLRVPGNVTFAVEGEDGLTPITLSAYEVTKLVQISKSVQKMAIDAFESWLTDMIAKKIAKQITATILTGTGSSQGKGIEKANTWAEGNSVTVASGGTLTTADVLNLISLLPGGYDANANFVMSKKTL